MSNSPFDILLDKTSILEIAANGTVVGTLATSDADTGDTFTYELLDNAEGRFSLVNGNQIAVADNSKFNYQSAIFHTIKVKTTDSTGLSYEKDINIGLIDAKRNLVGYWKLDETTGTFDNSSLVNANNDGTTVGSLNLGRPGQWNESVGFGDGIVSLGTNLLGYPAAENDPDGRRKFSVTAWIKPANFDGLKTIFSTNSLKDKNNGFSLRLNGNRLNFYSVSTNTVLNYDLPSYPQIDPNTWFHVALVYENNSPTLYANGVKLGSGQDFSLGSSDDSNLEYLIGADDYQYIGDFLLSYQRFTGLIDEVQVHNSALSEAEIISVINETNFAPTNIGFYDNNVALTSTTPDGSWIAAISVTDNFLDDGKHTFSLIDDADGLVGLEGKNGLVLKDKTKIGDITGSFTDIPIKIRATDPLGNIFDKEFKLRFFAIDPRPDLLIYYKFDEESSDAQRARVVDSTGNYREVGIFRLSNSGFYDGTKNPLTSLTSYGPIRGQDGVSGIADAGTSAKFSLGNYVTIPSGSVQFDQEFTVSVWVKPSSFNGTQGILSADDDDNVSGGASNRGFAVRLTGKRLYAYSYITGNSVVVDLPQFIFANEWFHVGASLSNNQITLYVNGVKLGSGYFDATKRPDAPISRNYLLGAERSGSNAFTGLIDEFRFYTKSLSNQEILAVIEETNLAPSNIKISNNAITSSFTNGLVVGELESVDSILDKGKHTYSLLDDAGGLFKISGNQILINDSSKFNGIDPEKLSIKVRATDPKGNTLDKILPIELIFADPKANLVAYYKLNESSNESNRLFAIDSSGNNKNGVYNAGVVENVKTAGATRGELGIEGTSVSFNNWQDYINLGNQAIAYNDQFTVSTWIRPSKLSGTQMILSANDSGNGAGFGFGLMDKKLAIIDWQSDRVFMVDLPAAVTPDQWTHIALKYVGNQVTLYLNGVALGSQSFTITKDSRNYLIGAGRTNANDPNNFNGQIDDLRFYDVALADDKIKNLGNQPPSALELDNTSLVEFDARYPNTFETVVGTLSTTDIGTDTHTYSLVENPNDIFKIENEQLVIAKPELIDYETTQSYDLVIRTTDTAGNSLDKKYTIQVIDTPDVNKVAVFDGVDDYIAINPTEPLLSSNQFTLEAWVNSQATDNSDRGIINFGENQGPRLSVVNQTDLVYGFGGSTKTFSGALTANEWHQVAVSFNGTTLSLYIDGQLKDSTDEFAGQTPSVGQQLNIGKGDQVFQGKLDDIRVWNVARDVQEIATNYDLVQSGSEPGLAAYYSFDIQKDPIAWDATGKNNNGSLTNGASIRTEELPLQSRPPLDVYDLDGAIAKDFATVEVPILGKLSLDFIPSELSLFGEAL
jgi:hypothetical protein